ncbi:MAG TPA: hypothetical protein VLI90_12550 [Tepidisphaeraceae bacterium]|nr:hypothetical protein [Tepidisphaeraceae bacterium]
MASRLGRRRRASLAVLAVVAGTSGAVFAADTTPASEPSAQLTQQQMLDQLKELQAEVKELKAAQAGKSTESKPATEAAAATAPSSDSASTLAAVQQDADRKTGGQFSFSALSAVTGYDGKGFVLSDESGDNVFRPGYILQARNNTNWRQNGKNFGADSDTENGWEIRRAKIYLTGNLFTPDLTYRFQMANQVNGPSFVLDDAWMAYHFYTGGLGKLSFKVGQFKIPVVHEEFEVGDEKPMAAERSLLNDTIGGGVMGPRSQGIDLLWNSPSDVLHGEAMLHDGSGNSVGAGGTFRRGTANVVLPGNVAGSVNTDFRDGKTQGAPIWGAAARAEWKATGSWDDYIDFTARASKKPLLVIGAGVDETEGVNTWYTHVSADLQYKHPCGASIYVAGIGSFTNFRNIAGFNNNFDYGALVQVAYAINHKVEPFIRFDAIKLDDDVAPSNNLISEFTVGVNYYMGEEGRYGHHAKFTLDASYLPIGSGPTDHLNTDELANSFHNEVLLQAQFQLWL